MSCRLDRVGTASSRAVPPLDIRLSPVPESCDEDASASSPSKARRRSARSSKRARRARQRWQKRRGQRSWGDTDRTWSDSARRGVCALGRDCRKPTDRVESRPRSGRCSTHRPVLADSATPRGADTTCRVSSKPRLIARQGGSRRCDVIFSNAFTEELRRRVLLRSSTRTCSSSSCRLRRSTGTPSSPSRRFVSLYPWR